MKQFKLLQHVARDLWGTTTGTSTQTSTVWEAQHLSLLIPGVLVTNCCEAAMGSQALPWCMILSGRSCWRSLRFRGSLSFVYFKCSTFVLSPWLLCEEFPNLMSYIWARHKKLVQRVEERSSWFKLRRWLPTHVLSHIRSTRRVPLKICILEEHTFVPFTSENTDQSRTVGLNLFQTDKVCGTGMTIILLLLTNSQSVFSSSFWQTPCTASRYNRFCL